MTADIAGKTALVTGASSGLGARFAEVLAAAGARVVIGARRTDRLEALAARLRATGAEVMAVALDVGDVASIHAASDAIAAAWGSIDILVNNAGISRQGRLEDMTEDDYDAVMDINLRGAFFMAQAAARQMIKAGRGGRIVNISSVAGVRAVGQIGLYGVSKAGLIHMTTVMAKEWGRHGINTNAICPGYIATEISAEWLPTPGGQKLLASLPRKRMGEAQDLDGVLTLLCSGQAGRFINGAVMVVDDGYVAM